MDPLITTDWLSEHRDEVVIADVRWRPTGDGRELYLESHIPGAVFVDLDSDLAEVPEDPSVGGRHPLPTPEAFCERLAAKRIGAGSRVVCYDDMGGAIAARLWWMLRWVGHERAHVLNGGLTKWLGEDRPVERGESEVHPASVPIVARVDEAMVVDKAGVREALAADGLVLDARAFVRYRGEGETLDPVGGHIAGAHSAPFGENLVAESKFMREGAALRERFRRLGVGPAEEAICHCGSGVTACHNILAMERAGLGMARLYVGSWSEWCRDPRAPKSVGPRP